MTVILHQTRRDYLLNGLPKKRMATAKPVLNFLQDSARLLRKAIENTGLTNQQAMHALGFEHESQFCECLDGKQKLWVHQLLRPEALPIRRELLILSELEGGTCIAERVLRFREKGA